MKIELKKTLREIGSNLDRDLYPCVHNGGVVKPGGSIIVPSSPGEDIYDVDERTERSAAKSRERATRRQGASRRSGPSGTTAQFLLSSFRTKYESEIGAVREAYPGTQIWQRAEGMWLLTESLVLPGLGKKATFLTAIPYSPVSVQKSWGFWTTPISCEWIGPRHTNFPDGSICAFNPSAGTWKIGDSLVSLLDLYTLWAFRHEHLNVFGRWPGHQAVPHVYERITESKPDELCGCDAKGLKYSDCCRQSDLSQPLSKSFGDFLRITQGNLCRNPPKVIEDTVRHRATPPPIKRHTFSIIPVPKSSI